MILTGNQPFGTWAEVFDDRVTATAILDRVLHHAITVNIHRNSYRLPEAPAGRDSLQDEDWIARQKAQAVVLFVAANPPHLRAREPASRSTMSNM